MRSLPIPTSPSKRFPTVYRCWYFDTPGMLARINGVLTFRSDAGVISEHSVSDIRYFVTEDVVDQRSHELMAHDVYWSREAIHPAFEAPTVTPAGAA